jgi:leader peptidase (prepilin peptidase)/N-methyltransferase
MVVEIVAAAVLGLLIGSFLNVCIYRLPRDLSVVSPGSYCPKCETPIRWYENIPLVSFLFLRGRCAHCGAAIGWRYPAVEFVTAATFALVVWKAGVTPAALKSCVFSTLLIGLIFSDLEELILPDELTLGGIGAGLVFSFGLPMDSFFMRLLLPAEWGARVHSLGESLLAMLVAAGSLWLVGEVYYRVRKVEGLGLGDVKMVAMIGSFLGLHGTLFTLILGSVIGSVVGLALVVLLRKDARTYELPFGSFLGVGALITGVWGPALLRWPGGPV